MIPDLSVEIAGIKMKNPVMNASGTFDLLRHHELNLMDLSMLGAYVPKSITLNPRAGNSQPRMYEVVAGVINRIGLQNVGTVKFVKDELPTIHELKPKDVPLVISVAGENIEEYVRIAVILEENAKRRIAGLELNVSCPNVKDGLIFGTDPKLLFTLVSNVRSNVKLPLIVKLTPNVTDIRLMAKAAEDAGADVLSLINTVRAKAYISRGPNAGEWIEGGLSGPAIRPIALVKVSEVLKVVKIPVIGMGGIFNTEGVLDFFRLGVKAVAVGIANFTNPAVIAEIVSGLARYMKEKRYNNLAEIKKKEGI